ncbi:MAG: hypothetical protein SWO11_00340 [Thermodesulfobacteriota bacterium]|nr:hypothetical protein [Thermodesulfobacteriota bacterium]
MRCQFCNYEGPRTDFKRNFNSIYTTASGLKPRQCSKCHNDNFFPWGEELEEDETELKSLCLRMDDSIRAGDINRHVLMKQVKEMKNLNKYLNAEWVNRFIAHVYANIRAAQDE